MNLNFIQEKAKNIRLSIINMLYEAKSGHSGGALGMADLFATLYFSNIFKYDIQNPHDQNRDRLILSNGHICPVLYATYAEAGFFDKDELLNLRKFKSALQGHPHREFLPILENSSGPLGSGLSQAVGMSIILKREYKNDKNMNYVYALLSDGEHNEGNIYEAMLLAYKEKLNNLIAIIDRNNIQIDGNTEDILPLDSLVSKYLSFNWLVYEINGHNIEQIYNTILKAKELSFIEKKPSVIILNTIPGKGVDFMENDYHWHGKAPNQEQKDLAIKSILKDYENNKIKYQQ